ncbi:MAG: acetoin:2,6-dichlorophenolindophenol oxidoreductase subunit alpha [Planctomycetaceae bacterium]|nr:MAG: acetoin:2,6-dichlorophenolindophenol oxidoreductase subunit alpha [Planctomycetaceae bacterium]
MQTIRQCEEELARCHQRGWSTVPPTPTSGGGIARESVPTWTGKSRLQTHRVTATHWPRGWSPKTDRRAFGRDTAARAAAAAACTCSARNRADGHQRIVASCILQSTGGGYTSKLFGKDRVSVCFFGDGAVNNGAFHEGLNMAKIWNLPVNFCLRKQPVRHRGPLQRVECHSRRRSPRRNYGMPGWNSTETTYHDPQRGRRSHRPSTSGGGPTLIECKTYRTRAHAEGMGDFTYRTKEDVEEWKQRCPISQLRDRAIADGLVGKGRVHHDRRRGQTVDRRITGIRRGQPVAGPRLGHQARLRPNPQDAPSAGPGPMPVTGLTFVEATHEGPAVEMERNPGETS